MSVSDKANKINNLTREIAFAESEIEKLLKPWSSYTLNDYNIHVYLNKELGQKIKKTALRHYMSKKRAAKNELKCLLSD